MEKMEEKPVPQGIGRSAAIVHAIGLISGIVSVVLMRKCNKDFPNHDHTMLAFAGVSFSVFAVFFFWSFLLAARSLFARENPTLAFGVLGACFLEFAVLVVGG